MKYLNVTTPDNIDVRYRLAGAGSRLGAAAIDTFIQLLVFTAAVMLSFVVFFDIDSMDISMEDTHFVYFLTFVIIAYFLIFFGYFLLAEIIMKGQTIGKRILGLRTIRQNGRPITFIQSIVRNLIRVFIDNNGVGLFMIMFTKQNKRLGDLLAGTIVISENPGLISSESLKIKEISAYNNISIGASNPLTPAEYEILKDYFARRDSFEDKGIRAQAKLTEYFCEKWGLRPENVNEGELYRFMMENSSLYM